MRGNNRIRLYMQILFGVTVVLTVFLVYYNSKHKSKNGNVSSFFPQLNSLQERIDKYPNGKIRARGNTRNNIKEGTWLYFDIHGNVELVETYENGVLINTQKPK